MRGESGSWGAVVALLVLGGCGLRQPTLGTVVPGEGPTVARADFELRVRHTDVMPVTVVFPSGADGVPTRVAGGLPAVVLVQGGAVERDQYAWLAEALARRGYVVALPQHFANLAFFELDNGRFTRDWLVHPPPDGLLDGVVDGARVAVGGHSLGGVVAAKLALEGGFSALVLMASYPDGADSTRVGALGMPSLSVAGASDCNAKLAQVRDGWDALPSPTALAVLGGVTHYEFTADTGPDARAGCAFDLPLEDAHARMTQLIGTFLEGAVGTSPTVDPAALGQVPGLVDLEVR